MSKKTPDSKPSDAVSKSNPESSLDSAGPVKTSEAIRAALRNKSIGAGARSGKNPYGADQKPPTPPYGTRRSMGKR